MSCARWPYRACVSSTYSAVSSSFSQSAATLVTGLGVSNDALRNRLSPDSWNGAGVAEVARTTEMAVSWCVGGGRRATTAHEDPAMRTHANAHPSLTALG